MRIVCQDAFAVGSTGNAAESGPSRPTAGARGRPVVSAGVTSWHPAPRCRRSRMVRL